MELIGRQRGIDESVEQLALRPWGYLRYHDRRASVSETTVDSVLAWLEKTGLAERGGRALARYGLPTDQRLRHSVGATRSEAKRWAPITSWR